MEISLDDVKRWKQRSIETARELSLFEEDVYGKLENVEITIKSGKRPKGIWFGYAFDDCHIEVYSTNYSSYLPFISEEANQSGMDHELIGHIGNCLASKGYDEQEACEAQYMLAKKRGGIKWKLIAKAIPFIQKRHKGVDLG